MLWKRYFVVALVVGTVLAATQSAEARRLRRLAAKSQDAAAVEPLPEQISAVPTAHCCPTPLIKYRHKGPKLCCSCEPGKPTVLLVEHPCNCCPVEVPVCLPACCEGEPKVCYGKGFLGRPTVSYEWCCGYSVRVAFRHCGDLVVTTWGR